MSDEISAMPTPKKMNVEKALKAKLAGQSYQQIAECQGLHKSTVQAALKPLLMQLPNAADLAEMKASMADHLATTAYRTIAAITDSDMEKATLQQKATAAAIFIDKSRLLNGESTSNIAVLVSSAVRNADVEMAPLDADEDI